MGGKRNWKGAEHHEMMRRSLDMCQEWAVESMVIRILVVQEVQRVDRGIIFGGLRFKTLFSGVEDFERSVHEVYEYFFA